MEELKAIGWAIMEELKAIGWAALVVFFAGLIWLGIQMMTNPNFFL